MRSYNDDFIIILEKGLTPAILTGADRMQYEESTPFDNRIVFTAGEAAQIPCLFAEALKLKLIDPERYLKTKLELYKSHGVVI